MIVSDYMIRKVSNTHKTNWYFFLFKFYTHTHAPMLHVYTNLHARCLIKLVLLSRMVPLFFLKTSTAPHPLPPHQMYQRIPQFLTFHFLCLVFFLLLYSLKKLNNKLHVRLEKATNGVSTADGRTKIPYATRVYELFIID